MTFETITYERVERYCPFIEKNVLMDVNEKNKSGSLTTIIKCCNQKECTLQFGQCKNKLLEST